MLNFNNNVWISSNEYLYGIYYKNNINTPQKTKLKNQTKTNKQQEKTHIL